MAMILTDAAAGAAGFILGCMLIVASDWSIYEKYDNGNLAVRETTGLIDYVWVFAAAGAVILVVLVHLCKAIIKRLPCKRRAGKNHPNPIHAV